MHQTKRNAVALSLAFLTLGSCGPASTDATSHANANAIAGLIIKTIPPNSTSLLIGDMLALSVTARSAGGTILDATAVWHSDNATVLTVSATGIVTAISSGSALVSATVGNISASVQFIVIKPLVAAVPVVARIGIDSVPRQLGIGKTIQLKAIARDSSNNILSGSWRSHLSAILRR